VQLLRQQGLIALLGHLWFVAQCLVLLEWVTAYWSWYHAVPAVAGRFDITAWPTLEHLNALGRFTGDPFFIMLASIQDMETRLVEIQSSFFAALCSSLQLLC
jgi:hypothetical protein